MNANITESYEEVSKAAGTAVTDASKLAVDNLEKLIELQMGVARNYASAVLTNAREALQVKDIGSARVYFEKQPEIVRGLVQRMAKDSGEALELGRQYADQAQTLFRKSADEFSAVTDKRA
ncbi:MAG: phasin family protein [Arenicellales bacterium]|jgi:phasin family protein